MNLRKQNLSTKKESEIFTMLLDILLGIVGIITAAFTILQIPIFDINWFPEISPVYIALTGNIILIFCFCFLMRDRFSTIDAFIFSGYIIWVFLFIFFLRNIITKSNLSYNIFNLIIAILSLVLTNYGIIKYWSNKPRNNV